MDDYSDILEIERSYSGGEDLRVGAEQSVILTEEDLQLLVLHDSDEVKEILELYEELDVPKENIELFKQHLLHRIDSWFVQVGDVGLIYLTNIAPTFGANLQVVFWDKKFDKSRRELVQRVVATGFEEFALTRVGALIPETNIPLAQVALRKIGFHLEGTIRKGWRDEHGDCDLLIFGMLRDEAEQWQVVDHLKTTSSAHRT